MTRLISEGTPSCWRKVSLSALLAAVADGTPFLALGIASPQYESSYKMAIFHADSAVSQTPGTSD